MSLKNRIRITALVLIICVIATVGIIGSRFILHGYQKIENEKIYTNVQRAQKAFDREVDNLDVLLSDWASWDDTYEYIKHPNPKYEESNLSFSAFEMLHINLMVFVNDGGKAVRAIYFDLDSLKERDFPDDVYDAIFGRRKLFVHDSLYSRVNGLISTSDGPMLLASRPILTSERQGPIRGTLIFGKLINNAFIEYLGELTGLTIDIFPSNTDSIPDDVKAASSCKLFGQVNHCHILNDSYLAGYSPIYDIDGNHILTLRIIQPRTIYNYGKSVVSKIIYTLLFIGAVVFILSIITTNRFILAHLNRLVEGVGEIKKSKNTSDRLTPGNVDEFAALGEAINDMLSAIENSEKSRQATLEEMRRVLESISDAFIAVNGKAQITYMNEAAKDLFGNENDNIIGRNLYETFSLLKGTDFEDNFDLAAKNKISVGFELCLGGIQNEKWYDVQIYPAGDGFSIYFRQTTERKRSEQQVKEKLNFIQSLIDTIPVPVFFKDISGIYRLGNRAALGFLGITADQFIGKTTYEILPPHLAELAEEKDRELLAVGGVQSYELKARNAEGQMRDLIFDKALYRDIDGKVAGIVGVITDATNIKEAENALRRSEERFRSLYGKSPVMMQSVDREGNIINVNDFWLASMGYERDEVVGKKALEFLDVESVHQLIDKVYPEILKAGFCRQVPLRFVKKSGEVMDVLFSAVAERNEFGVIVASHEVIVDVTERNKNEMALYESENKYRLLFESNTSGILIMTDVFLDCNEEACRIYACKREDIIGHSPVEFSPEFQPDGRTSAEAAAAYIRAALDGTPQFFEWLHIRKDGVLIYTEISLRAITINNQNVVLATMRDITATKRASEQLKAQHKLLQNTIESLSHPFYVIDTSNYNIVLANSAARKNMHDIRTTCHLMMWGRPKYCGHYGEQCTITLALKSRRPVVHERTFEEPDGTTKTFEIHGHPIFDENGNITHLIEYAFDITERKKSEKAIAESESRYRLLAESMTDLVCVHDPNWRFKYVSPSSKEILGFDPETLIGTSLFDLLHPEDVVKFKQFHNNINSGDRDSGEISSAKTIFRIRKNNGDYVWLEMTDRFRYDNNGHLVAIQTSSRDVSDRMAAQEALRQSEEKYRELVETQSEGIGIFDLEDRFIFVNPAAAEIFGVDREEVKGKSLREFVTANEFERVRRQTRLRFKGIKSSYHIQINRPDGQTRDIMVSGAPSYDRSGNIVGTFGLFRDITEQKKAEEALRASEEKMRSIFRAAPTGIGVVRDRVFLEVNERFCEMTGYSREELVGKSTRMIYPCDEEYEYVGREKYRQIAQTGTGTVETRLMRKNGEIIYVVLSSTIIDPSKPERGLTFTALDITNRKLAEEALRRSEHELSIRNRIDRIFLTADDDVLYRELTKIIVECLNSKSGVIAYINPEGNFIFPTIAPDRLEKLGIIGEGPVFNKPELSAFWDKLIKGKRTMVFNKVEEFIEDIYKIKRIMIAPIKQGQELLGIIAVDDKATDYDESDQNLLDTIADHIAPILKIRLQRDLVENQRRRIEEALKESEEKYRQVIETSPVTIWSHDIKRGELVVVSPAVMSLTGYSPDEFKANPDIWKNIIYPDDQQQWLDTIDSLLRDKSTKSFETRIVHRNGSTKTASVMLASDVDSNGSVVRIDGLALDITEKLLMENQIVQSEKMAAIGVLAAGVAHEFNNLLGGIMGNLSFGLNYADDGNLLRGSIKEALKITEQAAELVQSLLSYSRRKNEQTSGVDITAILDDIIRLTGKEIRGKAIHLYKNYSNVPPVKGMPGQLQQVFLNILINAIHAVDNGGFISISAWCNADKVYIEIADNGCGIKAENISKIFDPFFTTKGALAGGQAKGTGLGLSISYNIIKNHGGDIRVVSKENVGSQFTVSIPIAEMLPSGGDTSALLKSKRVLAYEFDKEQASKLMEFLEDFGANCRLVAWSEEVTAALAGNEYDLVLLDANHPAMADFVRIYEMIKSAIPSCPIFLTSFGPIKYQYDEYATSAAGIINKPFTKESLYSSIAKSLGKMAKAQQL